MRGVLSVCLAVMYVCMYVSADVYIIYICVVCVGRSGLNVQFLVAATGEKLNPQNKIVAARAELVVSDWTMR